MLTKSDDDAFPTITVVVLGGVSKLENEDTATKLETTVDELEA